MLFVVPIDLGKNELRNARIQNLATPPDNAVEGQVYFNTVQHLFFVYTGSAWAKLHGFTAVDIADFDEAAQDAIGAMIASTSSIALTYSDATPELKAEIKSNAVTDEMLVDMSQYRVKGRVAEGSGDPTDLTGSQVMDVVTAGGTVDVDVRHRKLTSVAAPTADTDAATKGYVDATAQGLDVKGSVRAATTAGITLSGSQEVDGVLLAAGDRVLVKDQETPAQNGIYVVAEGAWVRAVDVNAWGKLPGAFTFVEEGDVHADTGWVCTVDQGGTLDSTDVVWAQFSGAGNVTLANVGTGQGVYRDKSGNTFNLYSIKAGSARVTVLLATNDITVDVVEANLTLDNLGGVLSVVKGGTGATTAADARVNLGAVGRYAATVGNGSGTSFAVMHNLGTRDVQVSVYEVATNAQVFVDVIATDTNNVTVAFAMAPSTDQYRVVVVG